MTYLGKLLSRFVLVGPSVFIHSRSKIARKARSKKVLPCDKRLSTQIHNILYFSMRFVKETHSIEVVTNGDRRNKKWRRAQFSWLKKNARIDSVDSKSSDKSQPPSSSCMRARSESECQYSPQKRNTFQLLQRRGLGLDTKGVRRYQKSK